jgi:HK97 family phage major capsid protein
MNELQGKSPAELRAISDYLADALRSLDVDENGAVRMLSDDEQRSYDEGFAMREAALKLLERHNSVATLAATPAHVETVRTSAPAVHLNRSAIEIYEDRDATPMQVVDAATRALEDKVDSAHMDHVRGLLKKHGTGRNADTKWARSILARSSDEYVERFFDAISAAEGDEVRTVLGISTNANGKLMVPTHLDPTVILTNAGSNNVMRGLARQVTLTRGNVWHGITSAGVTASWDGEVVEVSDDTPTVGGPSVATNRAQAFAQASLSAIEDIDGIGGELLTLFADARERLEGAGFVTGSGASNQPRGIFTALNANTNVQYTSATAATIAVADVHGTYDLVPQRFRGRGSWLMHSKYNLAVKALGTAVSASFTTDLTQAPSPYILGRPVHESDDCPSTQTTTALDNEIVYGDFSNYLIVDKPGSMAIQYIPTLFNTANNLPDGRVGWFCTWRTGGDSLVDTAFALLVDKTSA